MINKRVKQLIKKLIPPFLLDVISKWYNPKTQTNYGWFGNYNSWEEASIECSGYDSDIILEKVKSSLLKVKNKEAVYERDSVLFDKKEYSWPLLNTLFRIWLEQKGKLRVIDFGGSLGSTYFQNKEFLSTMADVRWSIVEQKRFVDVGKNLFEDEQLKFYYSIPESKANQDSDVLLLSSVLQYLENPVAFVKEVIDMDFKYILVDRTSFITSGKSIITVQRVPPEIYTASYPCWFFNENELLKIFLQQFDLQYSFPALDISNLKNSYFKGFVLKRKTC